MSNSAEKKQIRPQSGSLYTIEETADYFQISRSTVWAWIKQGILPQPLKFGPRTRRITGDALLEMQDKS